MQNSPHLFICLDCETTGLDEKQDKIIEVALALFTPAEEILRFETLIDPACPIPPSSTAIHHITDNMVQGKPTIDQVLPKILQMIAHHPIIGHGIAFDVNLLIHACHLKGIDHTLGKNKQIDTLRMARHYGDSPTNSLAQLGKHFNIAVEGTHRAMTDVEINIEVFRHLFKRYKTLAALYQALDKLILMKTMPLGKHKGRLIKELPPKYLEWAVRKDFDMDLLFSLRSELKRRQRGGGFDQAANPFSNL